MLKDLSLCLVLAVLGTGLNNLVPVSFLGKLEKYFPNVFIRLFYMHNSSLLPGLLDEIKLEKAAQIFVQPLYLVCGSEYQKISNQIEELNDPEIRLGLPLLTTADNIWKLASAFHIQQKARLGAGETVLYVGHGSEFKDARKMYAQLGRRLHSLNQGLCVATLKTDFEELVCSLNESGNRKVRLVALMSFASGHTWEGVAGNKSSSLQSKLESKGFDCVAEPKGLVDNALAQDIWMEHIAATSR